MGFYDAFDAQDNAAAEAAPPPPPGGYDPGAYDKYVTAAVADEVARVQHAANGTRNHTLNEAAFALYRFTANGVLPRGVVEHELYTAAQAVGLPHGETMRTLASAYRGRLGKPRHLPELREDRSRPVTRLNDIRPDPYRPPGYTPPLFDEEVDEPVDEPVDEELDDFWTERPELTTIHQWARARMVGPWAVLGAVLTRVVAATSHDLKLPATVGDEATLNLFVALVGPSGDGKGAAVAVSRKVIDVHTDGGIQFLEAGVGSGEGLGHLFARRNTKTREVERIEYAVLLRAEEVDTIAALRGRQGSTLLPELRKAWAGEPLGFSYADPTKRLPIGEHTYRLCLLVGVQPDRAALLFDQQEAGGGTPQRFLWMPTTDPGMTADPLPTPAGLLWTVPDMKGRTVLPIPEIATRTIREARAARGRGEGDALDGHALLTRLKVAAALTLLASRGEVTEDDWRLAGVVMRMSDRTRGRVQATLARQQEKTSTARALEEGHREVVKASVVEQDGVRRAGQAIMRKLTKAQGWVPASVVRKGLDVSVRKHFKAALDSLVEAGQVEVEAAAQGQTGTRLRLAERVRP